MSSNTPPPPVSQPTGQAEGQSTSQPKTLVLVDGHSLAFRSYYAFAKGRDGGLRTSKGIPTSICYGFLKSLLETLTTEQPDYLAIAFDLGGPTYRHEADETYKQGRPEPPEDFIPDLENLQGLLAALNLPIVVAQGYEADDVIGTLSRRASHAGFRVKILSGDQDLFQLVNPELQVSVLHMSSAFAPRGGQTREFSSDQVKEKLGVWPKQVVDYKALCGDSSDNIPGVRGVGPKTAVQLLTEYGSLEDVYANLDKVKGSLKQKLEAGKESALHSQYLAQIHLDVPLELEPEQLKLRGYDSQQLVPWLEKLEFQSFLKQLERLQARFGGEDAPATALSASSPTATASPSTATGNPGDSGNTRDTGDTWFFSAEDTDAAQAIQPTLVQPQIIDTPAKLAELVTQLQTYTDPLCPVAWDTETTSLSPRDAELVGIGCCWGPEPDQLAYIPVGHKRGLNLDLAHVIAGLYPILTSDTYPKAFQNAKYDRLVLQFQGIDLAGVVFDTMLASYVINPENSHNLSELSRRHLQMSAQSYTDLVKKGETIADLDIPAVANYCGMDVYTTYLLVGKLRAELEKVPALLKLLLEVEQPLEPVLSKMETTGIRIDQAYLKTFSEQLAKDLLQLETDAQAAAGQTFNLSSPKQLSDLLFNTLQLDPKKSRPTKLGYSTDAAVLEKMQGDHPVIDLILEHRTLSKLKSTYVDALPALVRADTGRLHSDFNQAIAATGRLSSSNPNLQNIPIRTEFSRQIRAAFIPEPGWQLVSADYSQIELRIVAHLSQEPQLINAYRHNQDVHKLTAQLLLDKEEISPEERRLAKIINFGIIYGMGAQRFGREAGVSSKQAKEFLERFYQRYPQVFSYLRQMEQQAISKGYVETILGRRRYFSFESRELQRWRDQDPAQLADFDLSQFKLGQFDRGQLRAAANAPIQGSSADIIKVAMIKLQAQLEQFQARLLLQVHDELVLEIPPEELDTVCPLIQNTMANAIPLTVPLVAEVHVGPNWMAAK
jgi:DNA polymerase I